MTCEHCQDSGSIVFAADNYAAFCPYCQKGRDAHDLHVMRQSSKPETLTNPHTAFIAEFGDEPDVELDRELKIVRTENQRLRNALQSIATVTSFQKPSTTWRDLVLEAISIAKAALGDKQ